VSASAPVEVRREAALLVLSAALDLLAARLELSRADLAAELAAREAADDARSWGDRGADS
jgi:hypothetical protein